MFYLTQARDIRLTFAEIAFVSLRETGILEQLRWKDFACLESFRTHRLNTILIMSCEPRYTLCFFLSSGETTLRHTELASKTKNSMQYAYREFLNKFTLWLFVHHFEYILTKILVLLRKSSYRACECYLDISCRVPKTIRSDPPPSHRLLFRSRFKQSPDLIYDIIPYSTGCQWYSS